MQFTTFKDIKYSRPDLNRLKAGMEEQTAKIPKALAEDLPRLVLEKQELLLDYYTQSRMNSINYTGDTRVPFYNEEKKFFDANGPEVLEKDIEWKKALLAHPGKDSLNKAFGDRYLMVLAVQVSRFDSRIKENLKRESELGNEYTSLLASAKIDFEGKKYNLPGLASFYGNIDRGKRRDAMNARFTYFKQNAEQLDRIYNDLVHERHAMANKLGKENFVPVGYMGMNRTDYGPKEAAVFRDSVFKNVVPLCRQLKELQRKKLKLDKLFYHDEAMILPDGNPKPEGDLNWLMAQSQIVFDSLASPVGAFYKMMKDKGLFDPDSRDGKAGGGYCSNLPNYKVPFIFFNANGTHDDVRVLMHECGHAFQYYTASREIDVLECQWPTSDAAEIHSFGMELLTWPFMNIIFGSKANDYRWAHLFDFVTRIPYMVTVDEFQHFVYENPMASPAERNHFWKNLESKYMPWLDYGGLPRVDEGGFWQVQQHIYRSPFYYIDYALAKACALQLWSLGQLDSKKVFEVYMSLCIPGGSLSFLGLVKNSGLKSPFDPDIWDGILTEIRKWFGL